MTDAAKHLITQDGFLLADELNHLLAEYDSAPVKHVTNPLYTRLAATAKRLISRFGGPGRLYKLSTVEDEKPWEAKQASDVPFSNIIACVVPTDNNAQNNNTRKDTATIYIAADKNLQINTRDYLEFNDIKYYFSEISHYIPDGKSSVVYIIMGGTR